MGADHTEKYLGRQHPHTVPLLQSTPLLRSSNLHTNACNGYQSTEPATGENIAPHHHSTTHHDHHPLPLPSHYYQALQTTSNRYMWLALACLMYCAINVTLFLVNYVNNSLISDDDADPVVSEQVYHLTEFWNTFAFAVIESISLVLQTTINHHHSQQSQQQQPIISPHVLKGLLITNMIAALVPAVLMTMNMEYFEIPCHEAEYVNEILMSAVDFLMLGALYNSNNNNNHFHASASTDEILDSAVAVNNTKPRFWAIVAGAIGTLQLFLYNGLGRTPDGDMKGEVLAHYCEFAFGCLSGLITFWLCMDNKATADHILLQSSTTAPRGQQHSAIRVLSQHHPPPLDKKNDGQRYDTRNATYDALV